MLIDVTGIILTPGNMGKDCVGNGQHFDDNGNLIECCCDECDYMMCCINKINKEKCRNCPVFDCPNNINSNKKSLM